MSMKIKYVQLESDAFLTDIDFIQMSPTERGVYCSLIFHLTSNDGKCPSDPAVLSRLCNCEHPGLFEKVWQNVSKKFQTRNGVIKHKRVTKELRRAKKLRQAKRKAGLKGAQVTWQRRSATNDGDGTKGSEGNGIGKESQVNTTKSKRRDLGDRSGEEAVAENLPSSPTTSSKRAVSSSTSARPPADNPDVSRIHMAAIHFHDALVKLIRPKSRSDRTCFDNIRKWLVHHCIHGRFKPTIFETVLDYAREARQGRNPAAVFMVLMKKELGYRPEKVDYL